MAQSERMDTFSDEVRQFLDVPRVGTLATIGADGRPLLTPLWYARDGDALWMVMAPDSPKARNIRRDPRVTLVVLDEQGYRYVTVEGTARLAVSPDVAKTQEMAARYLGVEAAERFVQRAYIAVEVVCRVTVEWARLRREG